jgi:hypothetical protein
MALVAPLSKYKKKTFIIWMAVCLVFSVWFLYDGYFNKTFIDKHTTEGKANDTLVFNQKAPYFLVVVAIALGGYLLAIRNRKIVAEETGLVIDGKINIAYDSIQKIDKTHFDSKGRFTLTYRGPNGKDIDRRISDKDYDNLGPVLDHLVAKIS